MNQLKATLCPYCKEHGKTKIENNERCAPCFDAYWSKEKTICEYCNHPVVKMNLTVSEFNVILDISGETDFIEAMDELKSKDIIEFNLKMSQFKSQVSQTQAQQKHEEEKIHCPKCNSTSISTGARGVNNFWGMLGASKTVNRCGNCGFTWKP